MIILPTSVQNRLNAGKAEIRHLVRFYLDDGSQGIWDGSYQLVYGGVTYFPLGPNLVIGEISQSGELTAERITVTASNCSTKVAQIMSGIGWHQRPVTVFVAFLDDAGDVEHIEPRYIGFLDTAPVTDQANGAARVEMSLESVARELDRASGRVRSPSDQRQMVGCEDDAFFDHTAMSVVDQNIYWGKSGPQSPAKPKGIAKYLDKWF